jgi:hypothetical protein
VIYSIRRAFSNYTPVLKLTHGVGVQVGQVECATTFNDQRMFAHEQPTHVCEEEAALTVVRIGRRVRPFVMATMITRPLHDVILCAVSGLGTLRTHGLLETIHSWQS